MYFLFRIGSRTIKPLTLIAPLLKSVCGQAGHSQEALKEIGAQDLEPRLPAGTSEDTGPSSLLLCRSLPHCRRNPAVFGGCFPVWDPSFFLFADGQKVPSWDKGLGMASPPGARLSGSSPEGVGNEDRQ